MDRDKPERRRVMHFEGCMPPLSVLHTCVAQRSAILIPADPLPVTRDGGPVVDRSGTAKPKLV